MTHIPTEEETPNVRSMSRNQRVLRRALGLVSAGVLLGTIAAAPVAAASAPIIDAILDKSLIVDHATVITLHAEDADGDPIVLTTSVIPADLNPVLVDNGDGTGTLRLTPDNSAVAGSPYLITVTATAGGETDDAVFQATVVPDSAPILDVIPDQTMAEGTTRDLLVQATDDDFDAITLYSDAGSYAQLHATLTDHGSGAGTLHLAPDFTAAAGSPYTITVGADSLSATDTITFVLTVTDLPQAPVVTVPADITTVATSAAGAVVSFTATATDPEDGNLVPACVPASGSTFPIGPTTVTCTVTDSDDMTDSATFDVIVNDPDAPVITAPGGGSLPDIKVTTTSSKGKKVTFSAVATDAIDGTVEVTCTPPSGSLFKVGKTTVSCTATDQSGNTGTDRFVVTVTSVPTVTQPPTDASPGSPAQGGAPGWMTLVALLLATVVGVLVAVRLPSRRR